MAKVENKDENEPANAWMVRPCELYRQEFADCKGLKGRFHQYFIHGETLDCMQWKTDYRNCEKWETEKDRKALDELISSEKSRREVRLQAHYANDVWEKRTEPPDDWNSPLPDWLEKRNQGSYLWVKSIEEKQNKDGTKSESYCNIM